MVAPVTPCEHCNAMLLVPVMPGSPESGRIGGGAETITCSQCGKPTRIQEAYVVADPTLAPGDLGFRVPAICERCGNRFSIDLGKPRQRVTEAEPQKLNLKCPKCGGHGQVQQGMYRPIPGGVQFVTVEQQLQGRRLPPTQARSLLAFFQLALANPNTSAEDVRKALHATPELRGMADAVPTTRQELYAFLETFIVFLSAFATATMTVTRAVKTSLRRRERKKKREADAKAEREKREAEQRAVDAEKRRVRLAKRTRREAVAAKNANRHAPRKEWKAKKR